MAEGSKMTITRDNSGDRSSQAATGSSDLFPSHCMLTDSEILKKLKERIADGDREIKRTLIVHPILDDEQIYGTKIDLRLGNEIYRTKHGRSVTKAIVDLDEEIRLNEVADRIIVPFGSQFTLHPGEMMVARLFEYVNIPEDMVGRLDPRARMSKVGLSVSAGYIDPGFSDHILISFINNSFVPIAFRPLMKVASLTLFKLSEAVKVSYRRTRAKLKTYPDPEIIVLNSPEYDTEILSKMEEIQCKKPKDCDEKLLDELPTKRER
jgi:dCTP deaminase